MRLALGLGVLTACAWAQSPEFDLGPVAFRPYGFVDLIPEYRSRTSADTINTRYASLPLDNSRGEFLASLAHSRVQLHAETPVENARLVVYLEADFLQPRGQTPWRWRQYWMELRIGGWRVMAGQDWSLFRPNRRGIESEGDLMNTLVIEPAYHVGIAGVRRHSFRVTRELRKNTTAAVEWASRGELLGKLALDAKRGHWEAIGGAGTHGRYGFSLAQTLHTTSRLDIVGQQMWSRGFGSELLGIFPATARTLSVLEGVEVHPHRTTTVFGYGGLVYGTRSPGNRVARQWTAGIWQRVDEHPPRVLQLGAQFSQVDRAVWDGRQGSMWYWMGSARWLIGRY